VVVALVTASGAVAGAISTLVFVIVHDIVISDIWDMAPVMLVAGAVCGALITWAFRTMVIERSLLRWAGFTGMIIALMALIPVASIIVFDPIVAFEEVVSLDGPPGDLIGRAMPFTVVVTVVIALVITAVFGQVRRHFISSAVAMTVLMLLLGLNLTVVGLVEFTGTEGLTALEFVGLVVMLGAVYAAAVPVTDRVIDSR
jgi:hypothetical protein